MTPTLRGQVAENRSSQVGRTQIEAAIAEAEKIVASPGYSGRLKAEKRRELALMRTRLEDGDLQPGDQIILTVLNEASLTGTFVVGPGSVLSLPGITDIPLRGVLRSELKEFLTTKLGGYVRNPSVRVQSTVRLSILGSVGKPGFYQVPADQLAGDVIMAAGGPAGSDPSNTSIQRANIQIMAKESFRQALVEGKTVDQLNLRAGDELVVGGNRNPSSAGGRGRFVTTVLPIVSALASISYLAARVF